MNKSFILLLIFIPQLYSQERADIILNNAFEQAKKQNKNVFIKFSASWCKPCHIMSELMSSENCSAFFKNNYVIRELIIKEYKFNRHLENPGAIEILKNYNGKRAGIPFWLIFDSNGNLLTDSFNSKNKNIGNPSKEKDVNIFIEKLKETSSLSSEELKIISRTFLN